MDLPSPAYAAPPATVVRRTSTLLLAALIAGSGVLLAPAPADAATSAPSILQLQRKLDALGYPVGKVDGFDGPKTRRGLCAWRRLSGAPAHRGPVTTAESRAIQATTSLPAARAGRGVTADKTCQTLAYRSGGAWKKVLIASTGTGGTLPVVGTYSIQRTKQGWHTSSLYPSPTPNMYSPMYFSGPIAIHGSNSVPTTPASQGCVRVTPGGADYLFARLRVGDPVRVIGSWR